MAILLLVGTWPVSAQSTLDEQKRHVRTYIEPFFAKETEDVIKEFLADAKGTEQQRQNAINGLKVVIYNKAYAQYRCTLENLHTHEKFGICYEKAVRAHYTSYKIVTEYTAVVATRSSRCELESRVFDAELEFPPYEFLKGVRVHL